MVDWRRHGGNSRATNRSGIMTNCTMAGGTTNAAFWRMDESPSASASVRQSLTPPSRQAAHSPTANALTDYLVWCCQTGDAWTLTAYQLYVELEWVAPKVWRRFLVPTPIDLPLLHATLLFGMGWQGGHIHEFVIGRDKYGPTDRAELDDIADEENVTLREALGAKKTFTYVYDYGDDWRHKVKVEKKRDPGRTHRHRHVHRR